MVEQHRSEKSIFLEAIEKTDAGERAAFLDGACGDNPPLRAEVEALLLAHEKPQHLLDVPEAAVQTIDRPQFAEQPGTVIGPYKLLQQIGEGGMGTVFMAEQTHPVQRKVAVKVIKPGMDSRQVIARFEAERQALAMMDHVNIARVLDAGTTGGEPGGVSPGRPYFVMELVHGIPITKYCDDNHLTPCERLELFVPVCQAIQHAHQKGIIHRDIKPSNVMVTLYDGKPVPKVIDFGVAKATEQKLTERTLFTQYGAMVGTLEYMSPEQAEMSALGVDTRSDIYSLGVLLYELLTGNTPLSHKTMKEVAYAEILRMIKEDEPPKPSTRLSDSGEALASISANRHTEPAKLTKLVRGELDWIVMKTLEKDRNRRYETANGFAADVQRYLADEPVQACPPSAMYRFRKFARRNKRILATASLLVLALVLGTAVSMWQAFRATQAEGLAGERLETANTNYETAEEQRQRAEASEREAKTNEGLAKDAQKQSAESLKDALAAVDQMLTRVGHERLANVPQMEPVRRELMQDALKFYQKFLQKNSNDPLIRRETAMAYRRLADIRRNLGQYAEAETDYGKAFALFAELAAVFPLEPSTRGGLSLAHLEHGACFIHLGKREEREKSIRRAVEIAEELTKEYPKDPNHRDQLVNATYHLASLIAPTRPEEAEKIIRRNLTLTNTPHLLAYSHRSLAYLLASKGRSSEAEETVRQALELSEKLASEQPSAIWVQLNLGETLLQLAESVAANGRLQEAEPISGRAITILDKLATDYPAGPNYRSIQAYAHQGRASLLRRLNRTPEAEQAYRRALDLFVKLAADFPTINGYPQTALEQRLNLGQFLVETGRAEDALDVYRQAIDFPGKLAADTPTKLNHWQGLVRTHVELGRLLAKTGKKEEAETAYHRTTEIQEKLEKDFADKPEYRRDLAQSHLQAANLFRDAGRPLEAEKLYGHAIPHFRKLVNEFPKVPEYRASLGYAHNDLAWLIRANSGRVREAEKEHRLSLALFEALATDFPTLTDYQIVRAEVLLAVAILLRDRGDLAGAKPLVEAATTCAQRVLQAEPRNPHRERLRRDHKELVNLLVELGEPAAAEKSLRQALADCDKQVAESPAEPDSRKALAETRIDLALFLKNAGRSQEAEAFYRLALASYDKLAADFPTIDAYPQTAFEQRLNLGQLLVVAGRAEDALDVYRQAVDLWGKLAADAATKLNHWHGLVRIHVELGRLLAKTGKKPEAETAYRQAEEIQEKLDKDFAGKPEERRDLAQSHLQAADLFRVVGRLQNAEKLYRRAIDQAAKVVIDSPTTSDGVRVMGQAYSHLAILVQHKAGRSDEAVATFREALSRFGKLATEFPDVPAHRYWLAATHCAIGKPLHDMGRRAEAEEGNRRAIDILEKLVVECPAEAEYRRFLAVNCGHLANHHRIVNRFEEAEKTRRQAIALWKQLATEFPAERDYRVQLAQSQSGLAVVLAQQGKHSEAAEVAAELDNPEIQNNIAWQIVATSASHPQAIKLAVGLAQKAVARTPDAAHIVNTLGTAYYRAGDWKAAIDTLKRADALLGGRQFSANAFLIAMAHWQLGQKDQARKWYAPALVWMEKHAPKNEDLIRFRAEAASLSGLPERLSPIHEQVKADGVEFYKLVLEAHPQAAWAYGKQGGSHAELSQWKEAAAAFSRAIELRSDDLEGVWLPLALLRLKAGQTDDYRRLVSAALDRFGKTEELGVAINLAILAKLAPGSADELAAILKILERAQARKPDDGMAVAIRAHLLIRAGRAAKGVPLLEAMVAATPDGQGDQRFNLLFLAMGRKQLGRDVEALEAFRAAERWQDKRFNAWFNQIDFDRTRDELASMLGVKELPPK